MKKISGEPLAKSLEAIEALRALHAELKDFAQDLDFSVPSFISHADAYAADPEKLLRYAQTVIPARMIILWGSSRMTTQGLVNTFLLGVDNSSPYPMLL